MNKQQVLQKTQLYVDDLIKRFAPDPQTECDAALAELVKLTKQSNELVAGDSIPDYFADGIQSVINRLDSFRTGFARPYDSSVSKAAEALKPVTKALTLVEFVKHASEVITKAIKLHDLGLVGKSLEALRTLNYDMNQASNFEDKASESITVTVENDPMKIVQTSAPGTTAPSGTSSPDTAASNYVTNPTGVSAPPPVNAANQDLSPSKDVASTGLTTSDSGKPAGDSNFVAAGGGDGVSKAAETANTEDVAKAADAEIEKSFGLLTSTIERSSTALSMDDSGWADDLSSPEFLQGVRKVRW